MNLTALKTLEFTKIRDLLVELTGSTAGKEVASELAPSAIPEEVQSRLVQTAEANQIISAGLQVPLGGIREIRACTKRAELGAVLDPTDFVAIAGTLYAARKMKTFFQPLQEMAPLLSQNAAYIVPIPGLENAINQSISEQGSVRDEASVELQRIRRETRLLQQRIKEKVDHILHSAEYQKYFQDALVTVRGDRYVIPIKQEYRQQFPGIVHDQSASGATLFIEPMAVVNMNNDIMQLTAAEKNEVLRILTALSGKVGAAAQQIYENIHQLAHLDFTFAKARLAIRMNAVLPVINSNGHVGLLQARHPLIPKDKVVPIDVELGKTFTTLLITGPNTGGKTVSLKTVGLFALMAQSGLFIPALSGSTMPVFQNVYADIGDEQSIEQSLSTFSGHMTNLVRILQDVSSRDLVLIDEIGAGTDPEEGAALAMSILEYLQEIGAATIATTHYSELKTFAYTRPGVENGSVEFDVQTLRPTYRLLIGVPGSSNAFAISKRLGLSDTVIARARQLMSSEHKEFAAVLEELETQRNSYLERAGLIKDKEQEVEVLQRRLQREKNEWQEKKQDLQKKARDEAANLIRQTRREAESLIRELKEQFAVSEEKQRQNKIQQIRKRLQQQTGALTGLEHPTIDADMKPVDMKAVKPGDEVYVATLGKNGNVLSVGADDLTVQIGILKMNVSANDCLTSKKSTVKEAKIERKTAGRLNTTQLQGVSRQIDIRGMTIDEAVPTLDKFIDDAVMANLPEVLVIHGKGTGALRKGVRRYLENHPNVQTVKIGEYNEGGDGVSVAVLR